MSVAMNGIFGEMFVLTAAECASIMELEFCVIAAVILCFWRMDAFFVDRRCALEDLVPLLASCPRSS